MSHSHTPFKITAVKSAQSRPFRRKAKDFNRKFLFQSQTRPGQRLGETSPIRCQHFACRKDSPGQRLSMCTEHLVEAVATKTSFGHKYHDPDFIQRCQQANRQSQILREILQILHFLASDKRSPVTKTFATYRAMSPSDQVVKLDSHNKKISLQHDCLQLCS